MINTALGPSNAALESPLLDLLRNVAVQTLNDVAQTAGSFQARYVCYTNQSLASFAGVTGGTPCDGISGTVGQIVLLTAQSTANQNGPWVIGTITANTAPLTRPWWYTTGQVLNAGLVLEVSEGTVFQNSSWKEMSAAPITVDTTSTAYYPRVSKQTVTLSGGVFTASTTIFMFSTTVSAVSATINTQAGTTTFISAPVANRVAGIAGTGAVRITGGGSDTSTVDVVVTNW
jgi:hypothetical protein